MEDVYSNLIVLCKKSLGVCWNIGIDFELWTIANLVSSEMFSDLLHFAFVLFHYYVLSISIVLHGTPFYFHYCLHVCSM